MPAGPLLHANAAFANGVPLPNIPLVNKTANYAILTSDGGSIFTNAGAVGAVTLTLPVAVVTADGFTLVYLFCVQAAQTLTVKANTNDKIRIGGTLSAANGTAAAATVGNSLVLVCMGSSPSEWDAVGAPEGTWTVT